jgi:hypothetical protein
MSLREARPVNIPTLLIAAGVGVAFFAAEHRWYYQPDMIKPEVAFDFLSTEHMKARAAVRHMLINPGSAQFGGLRSVDADGARYVCGGVKAMDKSGHFADAAFVYAVAVDFARIDDEEGRMTFQRSGFKPCPMPDEEKVAQQKTLISPGALSVIKAAEKVFPKADPSALSTLAAPGSSGSGASSGGTMEQQLGQLTGQSAASASDLSGSSRSTGGPDSAGISASGSRQADPSVEVSLGNELAWRADRPPAVWPAFPSGHALASPTRKRTAALALALATDVEERWEQSKSRRDSGARPSSEEVREACRALLTIDPKAKDYPKAWAAFVRLRKIDREMAA